MAAGCTPDRSSFEHGRSSAVTNIGGVPLQVSTSFDTSEALRAVYLTNYGDGYRRGLTGWVVDIFPEGHDSNTLAMMAGWYDGQHAGLRAYCDELHTGRESELATARLAQSNLIAQGHRSFRIRINTNVEVKIVEPGGAANQSQPVRPETNRTSAAAGSGR
jgi:hypothetical protein